MKKLYILIISAFVIVILSVTCIKYCNHIIGDNKLSNVDSAPKTMLSSLSLRKDIPSVFTNTFSGKLEFIEKNLYDTLHYIIYINHEKVRIDKIYNDKNSDSYLLNLKTNEMIALNHKRQLYSTIPINEEKNTIDSTFSIIKTNNEKKILGKRCVQWRVKNRNDNTEITYWVSTNDYGFYYYLSKLWNSHNKYQKYFQIIPNSFGYMPFETVERNLLRDVKSSINLTSITYETVDTSLFIVPRTYALFSN
jgi:hypothetical protein